MAHIGREGDNVIVVTLQNTIKIQFDHVCSVSCHGGDTACAVGVYGRTP